MNNEDRQEIISYSSIRKEYQLEYENIQREIKGVMAKRDRVLNSIKEYEKDEVHDKKYRRHVQRN